jgi:hypothetical protein
MAEKLAVDPVHDRSRILRVTGSYNWIYGEPCPVVIEHIEPNFRYGLEELQEMDEMLPAKSSDGRNEGGAIPRDVLSDAPTIRLRSRGLTGRALSGRALSGSSTGCGPVHVNAQ